jgi:hypothetical protein
MMYPYMNLNYFTERMNGNWIFFFKFKKENSFKKTYGPKPNSNLTYSLVQVHSDDQPTGT